VVEGRQDPDDAQREPAGVGEVVPPQRDDGVAVGQQQRGVVPVPLRQPGDLRLRLGDRPAVVHRLELVEVLHAGLDAVGERVHDPGAVVDRHAAPHARAERLVGDADGVVDVLGVGGGHGGDHLTGRRVEDVDRLGAARKQFAADPQTGRQRGDGQVHHRRRSGGEGHGCSWKVGPGK
jgi:hypothetical protein